MKHAFCAIFIFQTRSSTLLNVHCVFIFVFIIKPYGAINLECQTTIYPIKTTEILFFVVQKIIYSFNWKSVFNVNYFKQI